MNPRPKLYAGFYGIFLLILWIFLLINSLAQSFAGFWSEFKNVEFRVSDAISANVQTISPQFSFRFFFKFFWEKPTIKLFSVFDHFSGIYEINKFWMIKVYLNISGATNENKHTKYANCGFHINFWNFLLMSFYITMKKGHFK